MPQPAAERIPSPAMGLLFHYEPGSIESAQGASEVARFDPARQEPPARSQMGRKPHGLGLEQIGVEIENPFEEGENDLDLKGISQAIEKDVTSFCP